jgi:transcriptional regulator with XRE-family HTH domain
VVKKAVLKITLKAARVNLGMTLKDAALHFGIHFETLARYENDSTNVPLSFYNQIEGVYGLPTENIFFGKKEDFDRKQVMLRHA